MGDALAGRPRTDALSRRPQRDALDEPGGTDDVVTHSRLRAWWLTSFCGYSVAKTFEVPRQAAFGRIVYGNTWRLKAPPDDESG